MAHQKVFEYDLSDLTVLKRASLDIVNISKKSVAKNELESYWKRFDAISPTNIAKVMCTEEVVRAIRIKIKKNTGIYFVDSEIAEAVKGLLGSECNGVPKPKK
jgi:hypothetical protein